MIGFAAFLPWIEHSINQYLYLDPESKTRLTPLKNKVIRFEVEGLNFNFYITADESKIQFLDEFQGEPDTILRGGIMSLMQMALKKSGTKSFHDSGIRIHGDVELAQYLKELFDEVEIDWEEYVSKMTGDVVAHQLGNMFKGFAHYGNTAFDTVSKNFTEYMQEEARHFPPREEVREFLSEIDTLRDDAERLAIRMQFLEEDA